MIPIPFVGGIVARIMGSRAMEIVGLILGAIFLLKIVDWRAERRGVKKGVEKVHRASDKAAKERQEVRNEVDDRVRRDGALERLRDKWSRD